MPALCIKKAGSQARPTRIFLDRKQKAENSLLHGAFVLEEPALFIQAGAVAAQGAIRTDDPVAGDDDGDGVAAVGLAHGPEGLG